MSTYRPDLPTGAEDEDPYDPGPVPDAELLTESHGWQALGNAGTSSTYLDLTRIHLTHCHRTGEILDDVTRSRLLAILREIQRDAAALAATYDVP